MINAAAAEKREGTRSQSAVAFVLRLSKRKLELLIYFHTTQARRHIPCSDSS